MELRDYSNVKVDSVLLDEDFIYISNHNGRVDSVNFEYMEMSIKEQFINQYPYNKLIRIKSKELNQKIDLEISLFTR